MSSNETKWNIAMLQTTAWMQGDLRYARVVQGFWSEIEHTRNTLSYD